MRPEVKRWFKIVCCTLMVAFSLSVGFSDWVYTDQNGDQTTGSGKPLKDDKIACAYIGSDKNTVYTIEDALAKATVKSNNGTTAVNVFVKPGTKTTIGDCVITNKVTLTLPYSNETYSENEYMNFQRNENGEILKDKNGNSLTNNDFADKNPTLYRKTQVQIKTASSLSIAYGGTLNIGGQNGGVSPQGATTGLYAEILLQDGASINCKGTLDCFGFIKEATKGGASLVMEDKGTLHQPLCIYDWGGAPSVYRKQRDGVFPFNRFDCPNIRPMITFKKGSLFNCFVHVWGQTAGHFYTNANIISDQGNSFLVLTDANSKIFWHFSDKSDLLSTSSGDTNHLTEINTYQNVNLSNIKVTLNAPVVGEMNIDSSNYYLPVFYGYSIKACTGNLLIKYRTKFLPGSKFYVMNGATATFSQNSVFYQNNKGQDGNAIPSYGNSSPALLSNSGIVNINAGFEGKISVGNNVSDLSAAKTVFSSSYGPVNDCYEGSYKGSSVLVLTTPIVKYGNFSFNGARGRISSFVEGDGVIENGSFLKNYTYLSNGDNWMVESIYVTKSNIVDVYTTFVETGSNKPGKFLFTAVAYVKFTTISWEITQATKKKSTCNQPGKMTFSDGTTSAKTTSSVEIVVPKNDDDRTLHSGHDSVYTLHLKVTSQYGNKNIDITITAKK